MATDRGCLVLLSPFSIALAQESCEPILFFNGRADQTASPNGGAVIWDLDKMTWRWWFRDVRYASVSADGKKVAYVFNNALHIADLDGQNAQAIFRAERLWWPVWSPKGDQIACYTAKSVRRFQAGDSQDPDLVQYNTSAADAWSLTGTAITIAGIDGKVVTELPYRHKLYPHSISWSPNGESLAFDGIIDLGPRDLSTIYRFDIKTGVQSVLYTPTLTFETPPRGAAIVQLAEHVGNPRWSPNGDRIAVDQRIVAGGMSSWNVAWFSVNTGVLVPFTHEPLTSTGAIDAYSFPSCGDWSPDGKEFAYVRRTAVDVGFLGFTPTSAAVATIGTHLIAEDGTSSRLNGFIPWTDSWQGALFMQWANLGSTPVVNSTEDRGLKTDASCCDTGMELPNGDPECTLRAAIEFINDGNDGPITFDILGGNPVIELTQPLLAVTEPVWIDGTSQPGAGKVRVRPANPSVSNGLTVSASEVKISGLVLTEFSGVAIDLLSGADQIVESCLIGTDALGASGLGNGVGIRVRNATDTLIGGSSSATSNTIASCGTGIDALQANGLSVLANNIGSAPDGTSPLPITGTGIHVESSQDITLGSETQPSPINAKVGVLLKGLANALGGGSSANVQNLYFNADVTGLKAMGGAMTTGLCIEDSENVRVGSGIGSLTGRLLKSNVFANIQGNALEVIRSRSVNILKNLFGTGKNGLLSLPISGTAIFAEDCSDLTLGADDQPSPINAKVGVLLKGLANALGGGSSANVQNLHFNADVTGLKAMGSAMTTGLCIEDSENVRVGSGIGSLTGRLLKSNVFANIQGNALEVIRSRSVNILKNLFGTGKNGLLSLPISGTAIFAEDCSDLTLGADDQPSPINAKVGVLLKGLANALGGGSSANVQNLYFNADVTGLKAMGGAMTTGLCIEDSENVRVGSGIGSLTGRLLKSNVFANIQGNALEVIRSRSVNILKNLFGTGKNGLLSLPISGTAIFAEDCSDLTLGADDQPSPINAEVGVLLKGLANALGGGSSANVQNLHFNADVTGLKAMGGAMTTGLCIEDSENVRVGGGIGSLAGRLLKSNVFANIQGNALEVIRSRSVNILKNLFGTGKNGLLSLPISGTAIFAEDCSDLTLGADDQPSPINAEVGVLLKGLANALGGGSSAKIQNLYFNADVTGLKAMGGAMTTGLSIENTKSVNVGGIGGSLLNLFTGINGNAVEITDSTEVDVSKSWFGTSIDDSSSHPTAGDNISVSGSSDDVTISENSIRNAKGIGVNVKSAIAKTTIRKNIITGNLRSISRSAHDSTSAIASASRSSTIVEGSVSGLSSDTLTIDFYAYAPLTIEPEADLFIGTTTVSLDAGGFGSYNEIFSATAPKGWRITSTVTSDMFGTSEFSSPASIAPPSDSDGDGLPDFWESLYPSCLDPLAHDSITEDCDGDGVTNINEYAAGTDPTVAYDRVTASSLTVSTDDVSVDVMASAGRRYTLERLDPNAPGMAWISITSIYAADVGLITLLDPAPLTACALYRIVIQIE